jgi:hypothetical protein
VTDRVRLIISVEGPTEQSFASQVLAPHLAGFGVDATARLLFTNRKLRKRGGVRNYAKVSDDIRCLMQEQKDTAVRFTTMLDLYALPGDFPGFAAAASLHQAIARVAALEQALAADLGDRRFVPYIQLHEFEALLFCDLDQLVPRIVGCGRGVQNLKDEVGDTPPEDINDGPLTAPSKRIIQHVPRYETVKVRVGATAAGAIGLASLRENCPHFDAWVSSLERLSFDL